MEKERAAITGSLFHIIGEFSDDMETLHEDRTAAVRKYVAEATAAGGESRGRDSLQI